MQNSKPWVLPNWSKRDEGVYENMTALEHEARYMEAGDASTVPDIARKIGD